MNRIPTDWRPFGRLASTQQLMLRGLLFLTVLAGISAAVGGVFSTPRVERGSETPDTGTVTAMTPYTGTADVPELETLQDLLDVAGGDGRLKSIELDRTDALLDFSARFRVPAKMATLIYDAALREGLDPELAFRLVRIESGFNPRARSAAKAYGLAQVQLATARVYEPGITVEKLLEPERNLRIGFQYLRGLYHRYGRDMRLALVAYNVGPSRLQEILDDGSSPKDAYALRVLEGHGIKRPAVLPR